MDLAFTQRFADDTAGAKVTAEQARNTLEQIYKEQPDKLPSRANLAQAYAAMGDKDLALKLAERAIMLLPRAKDAVARTSLRREPGTHSDDVRRK